MASKETFCSRCTHLQVCKHKDGLLELITKIDNLVSWHEDYMFANIDLTCRYFLEVKAVPRDEVEPHPPYKNANYR